MKKSILCSFLVSLFIVSCKKDQKAPVQPSNPAIKTYKVQYNLSGFNQTINSISPGKKLSASKSHLESADSSSTDSLDILYYLIYNSSGKFVHEISEPSTSGNFAGITDNLPAATYTVYFIAGKTGLYVDTTKTQFYYSAPNDSLGDWHDTFYSKMSLTVTGDDSENIVLSRFVSALKVNITDAIPANAAKIVTTIEYEYKYYYYLPITSSNYNTPYTKILTTTITPAMIGKTNFQQYTIMSSSSSANNAGYEDYRQSIYVSCYDAENNLIGNAAASLVRFEPNQETILSGNLFNSGTTGNSFQVSVNNTWEQTPYLTIGF